MSNRVNIPRQLETWFVKTNKHKVNLNEQAPADVIRATLSAGFNKTTDESSEVIPPNTASSGIPLLLGWNWTQPYGDDIGVAVLSGSRHLSGTLNNAITEYALNYNTTFGTCPIHTILCEAQDSRLWLERKGWTTTLGEAYLADTANYIITGRRIYEQEEWYGIFKDAALNLIDDHSIDIKAINIGKLKNLDRAQLFQVWIERSGGIRDVIITHQMLFRTIPCWYW